MNKLKHYNRGSFDDGASLESIAEVPNLYAQIVSSSMSEYDVTLVFYQTIPDPVDGTEQVKNDTRIVSRIILSHRTLIELADLLTKQVELIKELTPKQ